MNKEYIYIREGCYFVCNPFSAKILKEEHGEVKLLKSTYPQAILIDMEISQKLVKNKV